MMKARLAKKLAHTPFDRLAPYWIEKFVFADRRDERFEKALAMCKNNQQRKYTLLYVKKKKKIVTVIFL